MTGLCSTVGACASASLRGKNKSLWAGVAQVVTDQFWWALAGNKVDAYGGTISFTLGHSEYNSLGLGAQEDYDLIIESQTLGITLGHKHIVPGVCGV